MGEVILAKIKANLGLILFSLAAGLVLLGVTLILRFQEAVTVEIIPAPTATASAQLWLDIQGAVNHPGVYQLPAGSRIKDALVAAGGLTEDANRELIAKTINLAATVKDGGKLFFPGSEAVASAASAESPGLGINLNTASATELETLAGIGPTRAGAIIAGRPYQETEELVSKKIIPQSVYLKIADQVTVY